MLAACGGSPLGFGNDQCDDPPGSYPPPTITITGIEPVAVPWTSWSCTGYHADNFEEPPLIVLGEDTLLMLDVPIEDGAELEVRVDGREVDVDHGASGQEIVVPSDGTEIFVRLCTDDGRCANYEVALNRPG